MATVLSELKLLLALLYKVMRVASTLRVVHEEATTALVSLMPAGSDQYTSTH